MTERGITVEVVTYGVNKTKRLKKPKKFCAVIYPNPNTPLHLTSFEGSSGVIQTNRYWLDINYPLSDRMKSRIQREIVKLLKKY